MNGRVRAVVPAVDRPTPAALVRVAEVLATRVELWRRLVRAGRRRWSTRVAGGAGWEAWLVAWPGGDRAPAVPGAHDGEPAGGGAVVLLAGELVVVGGTPGRQRLVPGAAASFDAGPAPVLWNPAGQLAVSLHVVPVRSADDLALPLWRAGGPAGRGRLRRAR